MQNISNFSLLLKPVSADCNLNCTYCFYLKRSALYPKLKKHRMSAKTLELVIKSYLATRQATHVFCWQGGEPTLAGVDFFEKAVELQRKYAPAHCRIINTLQTNALLLDDDFCRFLARWKFLVGVSLDGPQTIHDQYRKHCDNKGTHSEVMSGIERLIKNGVEFNILSMVTRASAGKGKEIYSYLRNFGFLDHQYIPCVEYGEDGHPAPFSVSADAWGQFLCEIFEEWVSKDIRTVSIRLFDSIIAYLVRGVHDNCQMGNNCAHYFVVEYNGDIYPCDFFVDLPSKLGNIHENSWARIEKSTVYQQFGTRKSEVPPVCEDCMCFEFCVGDCLKHRVVNGARQNSVLCAGWKKFYHFTLSSFQKLADSVKNGKPPECLLSLTNYVQGV